MVAISLPHSHPGIEQVCYVLEGRAPAQIGGETCELEPGDCCFFPPDTQHVFTVASDEPVKVLVIYIECRNAPFVNLGYVNGDSSGSSTLGAKAKYE